MPKVPVIQDTQLGNIVIYHDENDKVQIQALFQDETLWLTQKLMAELFECSSDNIGVHLKNIFAEKELDEEATTEDFSVVRQEGSRTVSRKVKHYNLDAIIAVGYRVNSKRATAFRQWATQVLREYIVKGFALDDERLKNPDYFLGKDYFDEMIEQIRDIRSSERRFYQKITDIYALCSVDYDRNSELTRQFFATVQNKLHWAISKQTAAEIICSRANHEKPNMGLMTWKHAPDGRIYQSDVLVAKNYLDETEMSRLNRIVGMYLDYAENQAQKRIAMTMSDWIKRLDAFLEFNEEEILTDPSGKVSRALANAFAIGEYQLFRQDQLKNYRSDFDLYALENKTKKLKS